MNAILSTAINFNSIEDVNVYKGFSPEALPDGDRRYSGVSSFKVGFENIVLLDEDGYIIAKRPRRAYRSMAIDGKPVIINGPEFKRIGCEPKNNDDARIEELLMQDVDQAVADGMQYRVAWVSFIKDDNGVEQAGYLDFKDSTDAEKEYDARLKCERTAKIIGLVN